MLALCSCGTDSDSSSEANGGSSGAGGANAAGGSAGATATGGSGGTAGAAMGGSGGVTAGAGGSVANAGEAGSGGMAPADICDGVLFCEKFDDYPGVTSIEDQQTFGPWSARLQTGANMELASTHTTSGESALHVHINDVVEAGGRLFADGDEPIFADTPTHVYGRLMMYIAENGTSVHWTFFGVNGDAEPNSPVTGRNAQYIMSSLPRNDINTYSFVYGLQAEGNDPFHDCSSRSDTTMPSDWACISFEMDSVARKLRMYKDGAADPILSIDDHGTGCVAPTNVEAPWYGPAINRLFVGAWSFHPMNAPLDVWIDDLVVDTEPVSCPEQ